MSAPRTAHPRRGADTGLGAQAVLLTFCGNYLLGQQAPVLSGSVAAVLGRTGVSQYAARTAMGRMVTRGLLRRIRRGKQVYLTLTSLAEEILEDGARRIESPVSYDWDGSWTLLAFSLPESRRADRHRLRARLSWYGFGMLQKGLWVAPGQADAGRVLDGLNVSSHVRVFNARALPPTEIAEMIRVTWDLGDLSGRYRQFLSRWDHPHPLPDAPDDLARQLLLLTEWLVLVRADPRLPLEHLPAGWPSVRAAQVVAQLRRLFDPPARRIAGSILRRLDRWHPEDEPDAPPRADAPPRRPARAPLGGSARPGRRLHTGAGRNTDLGLR